MDSLSKMPDGVRYYCGAEARLRRAVEDAAMAVFAGWSYEEITTPALDYFALFDRGMGHGEAQRALRFTHTDGRLVAPRSHAEWRREWTQLGCELIGAAGATADLETLLIATEVLEKLGLAGRFRVTLNHVEIFNGVAAQLLLDAAARDEMRRVIDARDTSALARFLADRRGRRAPLTRFTGGRDI